MPTTWTGIIKATQNDMRRVNTALSGVVGQTTRTGFVPGKIHTNHTHTCLTGIHFYREGPNNPHPDALKAYVHVSVFVCLDVELLLSSITATNLH